MKGSLRINPNGKKESLAYLAGSRKKLKKENDLALEMTKIGDRRKSDVNYRIHSETPEPSANYLLYCSAEIVRELMVGSPLSLIGLDLVKSSENTPDQSISTICPKRKYLAMKMLPDLTMYGRIKQIQPMGTNSRKNPNLLKGLELLSTRSPRLVRNLIKS